MVVSPTLQTADVEEIWFRREVGSSKLLTREEMRRSLFRKVNLDSRKSCFQDTIWVNAEVRKSMSPLPVTTMTIKE